MEQNNAAIIDAPVENGNPFTDRASANEEVRLKKAAGLLATITTRKRRRPVFGVLFGPPGVGKSTFASESDNPIFIPTERGLDHITVPKFPTPRTFIEFYNQLNALDKEPHDFKTIVIDTADALELLIWERVKAEGKVKTIEDFGGGYGKGFTRAREIWTGVLNQLTDMSERFNIFLIAHSHIRAVSDPILGTAYDAHEMKVHPKSAEIIRQMVDLILFVQIETTLIKDSPKARKGRAIIGEDRTIYTAPGTGYEAKNRFQLDNPMEFNWSALQEGINRFYGR